jgi:hypothetical protein
MNLNKPWIKNDEENEKLASPGPNVVKLFNSINYGFS